MDQLASLARREGISRWACIRHPEEFEHPVDVLFLCYLGQLSVRLVVDLESAIYLDWSCFENEMLAEEFDEVIAYENTCKEEDTVITIGLAD